MSAPNRGPASSAPAAASEPNTRNARRPAARSTRSSGPVWRNAVSPRRTFCCASVAIGRRAFPVRRRGQHRHHWITPSRSIPKRRLPPCTRHRTSTSSVRVEVSHRVPFQGKDESCHLRIGGVWVHAADIVSGDRAASAREFTADSNAAVDRSVGFRILSTNQLLLHCAEPQSPGVPAITGKHDFVGMKACGTSHSAAFSIEIACLN
jgi:hypothetical protein